MFDVLADQTDTIMNSADYVADTGSMTPLANIALVNNDKPTFRTINVLMVETNGNAANSSMIEQCLRYMVGFECLIAQAGSHAAAEFALQADNFDLVITDEHSLQLAAEHSAVPTIIVTARPSSETTRKAFAAGALHCLPLIDLSPRLLETAIAQALSNEP
jgi:DNA-binding response OmpR family regulator